MLDRPSAKKTLSLFLFFILSIILSPHVSAASMYTTQVENLINTERQKAGLSSLFISTKLEDAAKSHNNLMFTCAKQYGVNSCFMHRVTLLNEPDLMTRIKQTGYTPNYVAENIAWGYTTPASVVTGWMNSSGHKANILSTSAKDIGCDSLNALNGNYQGMYWTCDFGRSSTVSSATPTPTPPAGGSSTPTPTLTPRPTATPTPPAGGSSTPKPTATRTPTPTMSVSIRPTRTPFPLPSIKIPKCTVIDHNIVCE